MVNGIVVDLRTPWSVEVECNERERVLFTCIQRRVCILIWIHGRGIGITITWYNK